MRALLEAGASPIAESPGCVVESDCVSRKGSQRGRIIRGPGYNNWPIECHTSASSWHFEPEAVRFLGGGGIAWKGIRASPGGGKEWGILITQRFIRGDITSEGRRSAQRMSANRSERNERRPLRSALCATISRYSSNMVSESVVSAVGRRPHRFEREGNTSRLLTVTIRGGKEP